jgi:hypothetical protein
VNFDFCDDQRAIRVRVDAICADFSVGFGFAKEYHVERGLRDSVLSLLATVTQERAPCFVAEQAPGLPKSY